MRGFEAGPKRDPVAGAEGAVAEEERASGSRDNIFNKRYVPDACCLSRVTPGEPRNWRLALRWSF